MAHCRVKQLYLSATYGQTKMAVLIFSVGLMSSVGFNALVLPFFSLILRVRLSCEDSQGKSEALTMCAYRSKLFC